MRLVRLLREEAQPLENCEKLSVACQRKLLAAVLDLPAVLPSLVSHCKAPKQPDEPDQAAQAAAQRVEPTVGRHTTGNTRPTEDVGAGATLLRTALHKAEQRCCELERRNATLEASAAQSQHLQQRGELLKVDEIIAGLPALTWPYQRIFMQLCPRATKAELKEPYLVTGHHVQGLEHFLADLAASTEVRTLHVMTHTRSQVQARALQRVAGESAVHVTYTFHEDLHVREFAPEGCPTVICDRGF